MTRTPEQEAAVTTTGGALVVDAGAGTGKTSVLVDRFLFLLESHPDWPIDSLVAITFTDKATQEMRSRVRREIEVRSQSGSAPERSLWSARRDELERLRVTTIHGLCTRLLQENAVAARIDPHFTTLDEHEATALRATAIEQCLAELAEARAPALALLDHLSVNELRRQLSLLLARRGVGVRAFRDLPGTETLLNRWRAGIAEMQADICARLLAEPELCGWASAVCCTAVVDSTDLLASAVLAAQEGWARLEQADLSGAASHFGAIALRGGRKSNWGGDEAMAALKDALKGLRDAIRASVIKPGYDCQVGEPDAAAAVALQSWAAIWEQLCGAYDRLKLQRHALDFDDLELKAEELLLRRPRDARLAAWVGEIRHLLVDEYQDTNESQRNIIYELAHPAEGARLFVVGDAKQSIYRFRQAEVSVFRQTAELVQQTTGRGALRLSRSFRTHASLVAALNSAFDEILRPLGAVHRSYEAPPGPLTAERSSPPQPDCAPAEVEAWLVPAEQDGVKIDAGAGRRWEAAAIAARLRELEKARFPVWDRDLEAYRPFTYGDAAVLFRAKTSWPLYEEELKGAGVPYLTVGGFGFFEQQEVLDLLSLLHSLNDPGDDLHLAAALRSPLFSLTDETLLRLRWTEADGTSARSARPLASAIAAPQTCGQEEEVMFAQRTLAELRLHAGRTTPGRLLRIALDLTGYEALLARRDRERAGSGSRQRNNVAKFVELALAQGRLTLPEFLRRITDLRKLEAREGEAPAGTQAAGAVQLMSIHAAKGLEFPVVVVADLARSPRVSAGEGPLLFDAAFGVVCRERDEAGEWSRPGGYVWAQWLLNQMDAAESKRLLYVACTRAADLLVLTGRASGKACWMNDLLGAWGLDGDGREEACSGQGFRVRAGPAAPALRHERLLSGDLDAAEEPCGETGLVAPYVTRREIQAPARTELRHAEPERSVPYYAVQSARAAVARLEWIATAPRAMRASLQAWAIAAGATHPEAQQAAAIAWRWLRRFRESPAYAELIASRSRYSEMPFILSGPEGLRRGTIDIVYETESGGRRLVMWRWSRFVPETAEADVARRCPGSRCGRRRSSGLPASYRRQPSATSGLAGGCSGCLRSGSRRCEMS